MAKNTGKTSESLFESSIEHLGKAAYLYRFPDAAEVRGRTGKIGFVRPAPSDYLVSMSGMFFLAEVKSTQDQTAFRFSLLRKTQSAHARMAWSAGALYFIFLHDLTRNQWYRIPYSFVEDWKRDTGRSSVPWKNLEAFKYELP